MSGPEDLERGGGHPVQRMIEATGHAERAGILLRLSDSALLDLKDRLAVACAEAGFQPGVDFLACRVAALATVRDAHGLLPDHRARDLELWRAAMSDLAAGRAVWSEA